jgi:Helicase HerA, central domain
MLIPIGTREDTTNNEIVYIDDERHSMCFGMTGVGKSTYLSTIVEHAIRSGRGVMVIDPHGGICDSVLRRIPKSRTKEVILVHAQKDRVAGINIFEGDASNDEKVAAVVDTFVKIFGSSFMFSSENVMRWACYAILEGVQSPTLMDVKRFLKDKRFMARVLSRITNPNVLAEFEGYDTKDWERKRVEQIAPVLNKLDQFLAHSLIRALVGQRGKGIDFKQVLDRKQILLINLEGLGNRGAEMVGGFAFSQLFFASQKRKDRRDTFTVVIDELQKFISSPIDFVLAESRKFGLSLHGGTQIVAALPVSIQEAIYGNVATTAVFRVSGKDAEILMKELASSLRPDVLQNLADYRALVRYLEYSPKKGAKRPVGPFLTRMNPPSQPKGDEQKRDVVIRESLKWFGRDREFILKKIDEELRNHS